MVTVVVGIVAVIVVVVVVVWIVGRVVLAVVMVVNSLSFWNQFVSNMLHFKYNTDQILSKATCFRFLWILWWQKHELLKKQMAAEFLNYYLNVYWRLCMNVLSSKWWLGDFIFILISKIFFLDHFSPSFLDQKLYFWIQIPFWG